MIVYRGTVGEAEKTITTAHQLNTLQTTTVFSSRLPAYNLYHTHSLQQHYHSLPHQTNHQPPYLHSKCSSLPSSPSLPAPLASPPPAPSPSSSPPTHTRTTRARSTSRTCGLTSASRASTTRLASRCKPTLPHFLPPPFKQSKPQKHGGKIDDERVYTRGDSNV
ncbi:hypothetical protein BU23DRAFT_179505 [Bimuria novae-zelandiae CBS 107.79]|uniref:Uncharacterized protein n=1 Tax=Bimuria novae-zelandiae CBS 107.79 TaxID=1447943 RepID=A0A6A5V6N1_9PLEO|nr:hypothetical protein BU23DRAFT_179505 [Bimuria novae-zelandiae CBS 107.79]